ncbi:MAG: methyltransferase domain-containing protein [Nitrososphaerales archaeon]
MNLVRTSEGNTALLVPRESLSPVPPTVPVFYNPAASINRSVSVAIVEATGGRTFCDALAGIGARGLRVAAEVRRNPSVTLVDINRESVRLARRNAGLNGVRARCEFIPGEANSYLYSRYGKGEKVDYVDVDPFGTPVPYLQAALRATSHGGIASFTATDTAVLCGVHVRVAQRRYGGTPVNNHFHHETGIRLLINAVRREAASLDLGVRPVAVHSTRHYIRVFVRVEVGPSEAEAARENEGHVLWCRSCGRLAEGPVSEASCEECGARLKVAGPLWLGELTETKTIRGAVAASERLELPEATRVLSSLLGVDEFPPWSFSLEGICSALHIASVSDSKVAELLRSQGYRTLRQPLEKTGLKTDAQYSAVAEAVREAAARGRK